MDFPIEYQEQMSKVSKSCGDSRLLYKPVQCRPPTKLMSLHHTLRLLTKEHVWLPTYLFPCTIEGHQILMVKCSNDTVSSIIFRKDWCFPIFRIRDLEKDTHLYASGKYKKLVFSILRTVVEFCNTSFRPLLDLTSMYIGVDENVVFTDFEERKPNQKWEYEAKELSRFFLRELGRNKTSALTILNELKEFCDWFRRTPFSDLQSDVHKAFENVLFWNVQMRILYVIHLDDWMENDTKIFPECKDAFVNPANPNSNHFTADFRSRVLGSNIDTLKRLLDVGDKDYKRKLTIYASNASFAPPSHRRSDQRGVTVEEKLNQGLTRIRDSFRHAFQGAREQFPLEEIQYLYQYIFPIHMIEFAKVQRQISFDAVQKVQSFLLAPQSSTMFS